jgi:NADH-quinone oxidoreductase subunit C
MTETRKNSILEALKGRLVSAYEFRGELTLIVKKEDVRGVLRTLKETFSYDMLTDLCGVDLREPPRFAVVYHLHSMKYGDRIRVKVRVEDGDEVETVSDMWGCADWLEREAYDMFGIRFKGHPDLRRILLTDDFVGYPLRKDFPTEGYDFDRPFEVRLEEEMA